MCLFARHDALNGMFRLIVIGISLYIDRSSFSVFYIYDFSSDLMNGLRVLEMRHSFIQHFYLEKTLIHVEMTPRQIIIQ